jgi:hypothetical protein
VAAVEIGTLRLRGPPQLATLAAFRIEDGLRTELSETQRLVLIRRMRPARRAVSARPDERSGAIRLAYSAATRDARHGRDAGDGTSLNCVWFESPAEARRLLLAELLAGRRPSGWFWRLAVPEWQGRELEEWLVDIAARALGAQAEPESLALVLLALERTEIDVVVRAVQRGAGSSPLPIPAQIEPGPLRLAAEDEGGISADSEGPASLRDSAEGLRARLPAGLCARIELLALRLGPSERPAIRLLERLLLRASPSLALAPAQLHKLARAWSEILAAPARTPASPARSAARRAAPSLPAEARPLSRHTPSPARDAPLSETATSEARPRAAQSPELAPEPLPGPGGALAACDGPLSDSAGLWLVVPSLIRLGFREWLGERGRLLEQDSGRTLLRTIARHHRIAGDDPALAVFEPLDPLREAPDWALCWRSGVDRWLRHRAGIPLHRLIRRRGEVRLADEALVVRFPLEAADIRLRRRALDVDPGWVDWLGLSVRYRYEGKGP